VGYIGGRSEGGCGRQNPYQDGNACRGRKEKIVVAGIRLDSGCSGLHRRKGEKDSVAGIIPTRTGMPAEGEKKKLSWQA